jgi:hypothetical protein
MVSEVLSEETVLSQLGKNEEVYNGLDLQPKLRKKKYV